MIRYSYRYFHSRPRLLIGLVVGVVSYFLLHTLAVNFFDYSIIAQQYTNFEKVTQLLIAWNIGVWTYLGSIFYLYLICRKAPHFRAGM